MSGSNVGMGDSMDLKHVRANSGTVWVPEFGGASVSGWFDIKHTSAATGAVADHSGPNGITMDGLGALSSGINPAITGFTDTTNATVVNSLCGIWLSAATTDFDAGDDILVGSYATITVDASTNTGPWTNTVRGDATATGKDANVNMFFKATSAASPGTGSPLNMFDSASSNANPMVTTAAVITVKHFNATPVTINSIFVADCDDGSGATVKLLAGRVNTGSGTTAMTAVTMNQNDTLAITYAISINAT